MKQAHKKRPPCATANSPPVLSDMGKLLYKSGKFIKKNIPALLNDLYLDITIIKRERNFHSFYLFIAQYFIPSLNNNKLDYTMGKTMNRIKDVLEEKGIKQTWLAERLGKSFCIVNSYVCNRRQPSLEVLFEIAKILQVDPKDLIDSNEK